MRRHKSIPPQSGSTTAQDAPPLEDHLHPDEPAWVLDMACCCPSRPAVRVVMPAAPDRPHPAEILLCAHHYRASSKSLVRARAAVYDRDGALISSACAVS
jgi:hypothetical protein